MRSPIEGVGGGMLPLVEVLPGVGAGTGGGMLPLIKVLPGLEEEQQDSSKLQDQWSV